MFSFKNVAYEGFFTDLKEPLLRQVFCYRFLRIKTVFNLNWIRLSLEGNKIKDHLKSIVLIFLINKLFVSNFLGAHNL